MFVSDPIYCQGERVASLESRCEVLADGREVWRCTGKLSNGLPFACLAADLYGPIFTGEVLQVVKMAEAS